MIKPTLPYLLFVLLLFVLFGCSSKNYVLYRESNNTGQLNLTHYSGLPTLGPCGYSRNFERYSIKIPVLTGKVESNRLNISLSFDTIAHQYSGYMEFIGKNKIFINLYKFQNGIKIKLPINGSHRIKIIDDKIAG